MDPKAVPLPDSDDDDWGDSADDAPTAPTTESQPSQVDGMARRNPSAPAESAVPPGTGAGSVQNGAPALKEEDGIDESKGEGFDGDEGEDENEQSALGGERAAAQPLGGADSTPKASLSVPQALEALANPGHRGGTGIGRNIRGRMWAPVSLLRM